MKHIPSDRAAKAVRVLGSLALLVALFAALACTSVAPPLTPPEAGGPPWTEVVSPHFVVDSDIDAEDARAATVELEQIYTTLQDVGFPYKVKPKDRVHVILLRDVAEYRRIGPYGSEGVSLRLWLGGEAPEPAAIFYGALTEQMKATLRHELTHRFVRFYYPKTPSWLNEGLAHYYETLALEDGMVVIGREPDISRHRPRNTPPPSLPALLRTSHADLNWARGDAGSPQRATFNRIAAWAFVHVLKSGNDVYRSAFDALVAKLGQGAYMEDAWAEAERRLDPRKFDADLASALRPGREFFVLRTVYTPPPVAIEGVRQLLPAQVHLLWAALLQSPAEADTALRLAPLSPPALRTRAHLSYVRGALDAAEQDLDRARMVSPDDPRVLFDLFVLDAKRSLAKGAPPFYRERALALVPRLVPVASSALGQSALAAGLAEWGRPEEAMPLALKSIETDRSCWLCYQTVAGILFDRGEVANALAAQTLSVELMPEEITGLAAHTAYVFLRKYKAAQKTLLDDAVIRTILRRREDAYQRCYTDALVRDPKLQGSVVAGFVVEPDGSVSNLKDAGSTLPDAKAVACVLAEVGQLRFPPRPGGAAQAVRHSMLFAPPGPTPGAAAPPPAASP